MLIDQLDPVGSKDVNLCFIVSRYNKYWPVYEQQTSLGNVFSPLGVIKCFVNVPLFAKDLVQTS